MPKILEDYLNPENQSQENLHEHHNHGGHDPDIPTNYDSTRPPHLNPTTRCQVCGRRMGANNGGDADSSSHSSARTSHGSDMNGPYRAHDGIAIWLKNIESTTTPHSPEGVENHHIRMERPLHRGHRILVPGYGMIPLWDIFMALARHCECDCHRFPLAPHADDMYTSTAADDDMYASNGDVSTPSSSVYVEAGNSSAGHSPASFSGCSSRSVSYGNLDLASFMGARFAAELAEAPALRYRFVALPLPLLEDPVWPEAGIGGGLLALDVDSDGDTMGLGDEGEDWYDDEMEG